MARRRCGLALSGGGFRAAFFHLGVLARLAELDRLRELHAISTVSGGSIIGIAYYLRLKRLLEHKPDAEIGPGDYLEVVDDVDRAFRAAVAKNIRARILLNPVKDLLMLLPRYTRSGRSYSRTDRVGDLIDRYLYKPLWGEPRQPRHGGRPLSREKQVELRELLVRPAGHPPDAPFDPDEDNAGRRNRVPILIVNATSLNTGHGWRFEATRMGEHDPGPGRGDDPALADIDRNRRLRPGYFDPPRGYAAPALGEGRRRIPDGQQDFPLALAAAASAAVPALFKPLAISGMYEGAKVELVDGGVHDNQGVQALVDRGCEELIVSDGSAQMEDLAKPGTLAPTVAGRSLSIFSDRVREQQLSHPDRGRGGDPAAGGSLRLVHLRIGLPAVEVRPGGPWSGDRGSGAAGGGGLAESQQALSRIRTDLDLFSEAEASALAADGYELAGERLGRPAEGARWSFLAALGPLADPEGSGLDRHLRVASRRFLRLPALLLPRCGGRCRLVAVAALALAAVAGALAAWGAGGVATWVLYGVVALALATLALVAVLVLLALAMLLEGQFLRLLGRLPGGSVQAARRR